MAALLRRVVFQFCYNLSGKPSINHLSLRYKTKLVDLKTEPDLQFDVIQRKRRNEALNSILFVHSSKKNSLLSFCQNYGAVINAYFFNKIGKEYALIEFANGLSINKLMCNAKHFPNSKRIPMDSHGLFFSQNSSHGQYVSQNIRNIKIFDVNDFGSIDFSASHLLTCQSVESQMNLLHKKQSLSELDIRLRYFIAAEIERSSRKLFPNSVAYLFGSCVTGLGRYNGDVDINLEIEQIDQSSNQNNGTMRQYAAYFITKIRPENHRTFCQHLLECYGSLMKHFVPQMINVKPILRARVPIVKFMHSQTDIDCDLCIGNREAIEMSQHLHKLCHNHSFVLPLIFSIRQWAKSNEVTKSYPGPWLSNFMLTLLIIFFLQRHPLSLLPAIKTLNKNSTSERKKWGTINAESIILEFFKFYSELDFSLQGISVYEGTFVSKPEDVVVTQADDSGASVTTTTSAPLYLENPVERNLNAAKNVMEADLIHFQKSCAIAHGILSTSSKPDPNSPWGLMKILSTEDLKTDDENEFNSLKNENVASVPYEGNRTHV